MKIKTPVDNLILLPMEVLPRIKNASATELKVLLYLYAKKECSSPELAQQLGITPADADAARRLRTFKHQLDADLAIFCRNNSPIPEAPPVATAVLPLNSEYSITVPLI